MVNSRKRIVVMLSSLAFLFIFIIGISYAYYTADVKGNPSKNPSLKLTSGYLSIVYEDGNSEISGGSTSGTTSDLIYTKNFSLTNDGVADSYFGVWIKNYQVLDSNGTETTLSRPEDWTYVLKSGDTIIKTGTFPTEDEAIISAYPLAIGETKDLTLTVTYNYITESDAADLGLTLQEANQILDMGKVLSFEISMVQSLSNLESAKHGTLLYAIKNDNELSTPETTPGQNPSLETEMVLAPEEDDYGISYYYRGNVQNNYVTYSNMCWRIVRVQGDGTTKLVLADGEHPCGTANGYSLTDTDSAFIADEEGNARMDIAYKTGATSSSASESNLLFSNSDIPLVLSTWAEENNLDTSKLIETEWCNDTAVTTDLSSGYDIDGNEITDPDDAVEWNPNYHYGAFDRLVKKEAASPSLKCNTKGLDNTKPTRYKNILGVLSADEVAFAGSTNYYYSWTYNYYLKTNASSNLYWTLSPSEMINNFYDVWVVKNDSSLAPGEIPLDRADGSVRPSIVLQSDVTIQDGSNGTIDNPYVISD